MANTKQKEATKPKEEAWKTDEFGELICPSCGSIVYNGETHCIVCNKRNPDPMADIDPWP